MSSLTVSGGQDWSKPLYYGTGGTGTTYTGVPPILIDAEASLISINVASARNSGIVTTGAQTIAGVKTFTSLPACSTLPIGPNDLVNKAYADSNGSMAVIDFHNFSVVPSNPTVRDSYISRTTVGDYHINYIYTYTGTGWYETSPIVGTNIYLTSAHELMLYQDSITGWVDTDNYMNHQHLIGSGTLTHSDIDNRLGQAVNEYSAVKFNSVHITSSDAPSLSKGSSLVSKLGKSKGSSKLGKSVGLPNDTGHLVLESGSTYNLISSFTSSETIYYASFNSSTSPEYGVGIPTKGQIVDEELVISSDDSVSRIDNNPSIRSGLTVDMVVTADPSKLTAMKLKSKGGKDLFVKYLVKICIASGMDSFIAIGCDSYNFLSIVCYDDSGNDMVIPSLSVALALTNHAHLVLTVNSFNGESDNQCTLTMNDQIIIGCALSNGCFSNNAPTSTFLYPGSYDHLGLYTGGSNGITDAIPIRIDAPIVPISITSGAGTFSTVQSPSYTGNSILLSGTQLSSISAPKESNLVPKTSLAAPLATTSLNNGPLATTSLNNGPKHINYTIDASGESRIRNGTIWVDVDVNAQGSIIAGQDVSASGSLSSAGDTTVGGDLYVTGTIHSSAPPVSDKLIVEAAGNTLTINETMTGMHLSDKSDATLTDGEFSTDMSLVNTTSCIYPELSSGSDAAIDDHMISVTLGTITYPAAVDLINHSTGIFQPVAISMNCNVNGPPAADLYLFKLVGTTSYIRLLYSVVYNALQLEAGDTNGSWVTSANQQSVTLPTNALITVQLSLYSDHYVISYDMLHEYLISSGLNWATDGNLTTSSMTTGADNPTDLILTARSRGIKFGKFIVTALPAPTKVVKYTPKVKSIPTSQLYLDSAIDQSLHVNGILSALSLQRSDFSLSFNGPVTLFTCTGYYIKLGEMVFMLINSPPVQANGNYLSGVYGTSLNYLDIVPTQLTYVSGLVSVNYTYTPCYFRITCSDDLAKHQFQMNIPVNIQQNQTFIVPAQMLTWML